jgi:putative ABC transport system permease protein
MNKWLQDFAYHTYQWWVFALAGLAALLIALTTVSFQAIKSALEPGEKFTNGVGDYVEC